LAAEKDKIELFFKEMGELISKFRKEKKFSLEELGLQIGLDRSHMHRIEKGKPLTIKTIIKLCMALDKKPKDFFTTTLEFGSHELGSIVKSKKSPKKKSKPKREKTIKKNSRS
jgi:transcriptional regulator with XRE-family HTH domain